MGLDPGQKHARMTSRGDEIYHQLSQIEAVVLATSIMEHATNSHLGERRTVDGKPALTEQIRMLLECKYWSLSPKVTFLKCRLSKTFAETVGRIRHFLTRSANIDLLDSLFF